MGVAAIRHVFIQCLMLVSTVSNQSLSKVWNASKQMRKWRIRRNIGDSYSA